jgi:ketosteroid isomerase-like protein
MKQSIYLSGKKYQTFQKGSTMRQVLMYIAFLLLLITCKPSVDMEKVKNEIFLTEKAFEKMASDQSIAAAFFTFADENAVINRGNDSLIHGREGIRNYYSNPKLQNAKVNWTPDFVDVSEDGTIGYTFGKYEWKVIKGEGDTLVSRGVFHTVWKRQKDGSWKYVWD